MEIKSAKQLRAERNDAKYKQIALDKAVGFAVQQIEEANKRGATETRAWVNNTYFDESGSPHALSSKAVFTVPSSDIEHEFVSMFKSKGYMVELDKKYNASYVFIIRW